MANVSGITIVIKAFLPTGKTLDEQFNALTLVKETHAAGDYSTLLKAAKVEEVKTEQKTRRVEDAPQTTTTTATATTEDDGGETTGAETANDGEQPAEEPAGDTGDENVPKFLQNSRKGKAA